MESVETILKKILDSIGVNYSDIAKNELAGQTIYSIQVDDARSLIGHGGDTVHALDYLVKRIVEQQHEVDRRKTSAAGSAVAPSDHEGPFFLVDVNEYRAKQIKDLQTKALVLAERARSFQYDVELTPMSAYERLIVHTTLQDAPNVKTESQGEGRNRRVVIKYSAQ